HLSPHSAIRYGFAPAILLHIGDEITHRSLVEVEVVTLLLEYSEDPLWINVGPIRQHHDVLAIRWMPFATLAFNDQWTIQAGLFLETRMRVIPIRSVLIDLELIRVRSSARNAFEAHARHTVHISGHDEPVPVDRAARRQIIAHTQRHGIALSEAKQRCGDLPIHDGRRTLRSGEIRSHPSDPQIELGPRQHCLLRVLCPRELTRSAEHEHAGPRRTKECSASHLLKQ